MQQRHLKLVCGFLVLAACAGMTTAQTWSPEQLEVWAVEEKQWQMGAAKDLTWIDTLVHPSISVWATDRPLPQNLASLQRWNRYSVTESTVLEQELFPLAITITGDVAVVQYGYVVASEDLKKERSTVTGRYTDILVKENGRWLFLAWAGGDDPKD